MSQTPTSDVVEVFSRGPEQVQETTRWARGVVYNTSKKLKELETMSYEALPSQLQELRSATVDLVRKNLVPVLRNSATTARVGALLSRQGQNVYQLKREHREGFLRGTAHLVWDCHQRAEGTARQLHDIRQAAVTLLEHWVPDKLLAQDDDGDPSTPMVSCLMDILQEVSVLAGSTPFDLLAEWWDNTLRGFCIVLYNANVANFALQAHWEVINDTWKRLEYSYEEYKAQVDKAFDLTFGPGMQEDNIMAPPNIDIDGRLPNAFLLWAEQQNIPTNGRFSEVDEQNIPAGIGVLERPSNDGHRNGRKESSGAGVGMASQYNNPVSRGHRFGLRRLLRVFRS